MKIKFLYIAYIILFFKGIVTGQSITGKVMEQTSQGFMPLPGVNVYWLNTVMGTVSNKDGNFLFEKAPSLPAHLVLSMVGYLTDTLLVTQQGPIEVHLQSSVSLKEVTIERKRESTHISTINPINTQVITTGELKKAACCNLAESFETNPSVDVNYTDAVSGARQIQMLGLDGIYTQILSENLPLIRGLNSSYGLSYIPGPFVESIYVTKGTGSVVNGYESISGQINVEVTEPDKADKWFVNGYVNSDLRSELNIHLAKRLNPHVSSILFLHGSDAGLKKDMNHDSFLDVPLGQQYNIYNRWHFQSSRMEGQLGLRAVIDNKNGGQRDDAKNIQTPGLPNRPYKINIQNRQFEVYTKTGILFPDKDDKSIGLMTSTRYNIQDMDFGLKNYKGNQTGFYGNLIYQNLMFGSKSHKFKAGTSFVYDEYRETYNDSVMNHHELVPGVFGEYHFSNTKNVSFILGSRLDYHNQYGWFFTPRVHFKYDIRTETILRISGGSGFRTAQVFTENSSVMASSRILRLEDTLLPEKAWNTGISLSHHFEVGEREGTIVIDYFYTSFVNQVVVDLENVHEVKFYNLDGKSYSHSYQAQIDFSPFNRFDVRLAYKRYDVKETYGAKLLEKPFVPRDRALLNLAYATHMDKWKFDVTLKWFGLSRIPDTQSNPELYRLPAQSSQYFNLMAQVTKAFRKFDIYLGAENITNYIQKNAILASNDPYGSNFDASMVWAPLTGRVLYAGFRFNLN